MTIADATDLPILLYNVPSRTGLNLLPATLKELAKHENIVGVKEASGNIEQIAEIACTCPELALYSGNDDQVLPLLALGGKGVISVVANLLPGKTHDMVRLWMEGDIAGSRALQFELFPLIKALFSEVNPIPVKTALCDMGFDCGPLRLPLCDPTERGWQRSSGAGAVRAGAGKSVNTAGREFSRPAAWLSTRRLRRLHLRLLPEDGASMEPNCPGTQIAEHVICSSSPGMPVWSSPFSVLISTVLFCRMPRSFQKNPAMASASN